MGNEITFCQQEMELERESICQEVEKGVKVRVELEVVQVRVEELLIQRDTAVAKHQEAVRQVHSLQEEQESLQTELAINKKKRKDSLRSISHNMSDIASQLDTVQTSWTPRKMVANMREKVADIQKDTVSDDEDELLRGA